MKNCHVVENIFTEKDIKALSFAINSSESKADSILGREIREISTLPDLTIDLGKIPGMMFNKNLVLGATTYVKYSLDHGQPNLPPHLDRDKSEIIVNYQYGSNTVWPLGVNKDLYKISNNSALIFNPNTNIHWRPIKNFESDEFVEMIFFRLLEKKDNKVISDYTYLLAEEGKYDATLEDIIKHRKEL
jgi:hypothetical protein